MTNVVAEARLDDEVDLDRWIVAFRRNLHKVRCIDCANYPKIQHNHNSFGPTKLGDSYCPVAYQTLRAGTRSGQAFRTWRNCPNYEPNTKEEVITCK